MVGSDHFEATRFDALISSYSNLFDAFGGKSIARSIAVSKWVCWIIKVLCVHVLRVRRIVGAGPPQILIMSNIWKRKSEARVAGKVPAAVTMDVTLVDLSGSEEG